MAYADFVTALMALFIVLWMMNASQKVKTSDQRLLQRSARLRAHGGRRAASKSGEGIVVDRNNMEEIRKQLEQALSAMPEFGKPARST